MSKKIITGIILVFCCAALVLAACGKKKDMEEIKATVSQTEQTQATEEMEKLPWELPGAKQPKDYTWDEYSALTPEEQSLFYNAFEQSEFDAWLEKNEPAKAIQAPWDVNGAKTPDAYTWEEYNQLTDDQQILFFNWFENEAAFEKWMSGKTTPETVKAPWDQPGSKQPAAYEWWEYQALSTEEQSMFFNSIGGEAAFREWKNRVNPEKPAESIPDETEIVLKSEYTWHEYLALTEQEQTAYFQSFESEAAFNAWMDSVKPDKSEKNPWEWPDTKQPEDYTWNEYDKLPVDQQMAFFNYLNAQGKFDAWLAENQPK